MCVGRGGAGDSDGDGAPDDIDICPGQRGHPPNGCPGSDGDGYFFYTADWRAFRNHDCDDNDPNTHPGAVDLPDDHVDQDCSGSDARGEGSLPPGLLPPLLIGDSDGDGVADGLDQCISTPGPASTRGCPDRDGDDWTDSTDGCPDVAGDRLGGCPDDDSDGHYPYAPEYSHSNSYDCNDHDASIHARANDPQGDGRDQDCDGHYLYTETSREPYDCNDGDLNIYRGAPDPAGEGLDQDCDSWMGLGALTTTGTASTMNWMPARLRLASRTSTAASRPRLRQAREV